MCFMLLSLKNICFLFGVTNMMCDPKRTENLARKFEDELVWRKTLPTKLNKWIEKEKVLIRNKEKTSAVLGDICRLYDTEC